MTTIAKPAKMPKHILPIRILRGSKDWTPSKIATVCARAQADWRRYGMLLQFEQLADLQDFDAPMEAFNEDDWPRIHKIAREFPKGRTIIFVRTVHMGGKQWGGQGWNEGPMVISTSSLPTVVGHEIGHSLSLPHIDLKCNLMSRGRESCRTVSLTGTQVLQAHASLNPKPKIPGKARSIEDFGPPIVCG
jgi:hypothetical protein